MSKSSYDAGKKWIPTLLLTIVLGLIPLGGQEILAQETDARGSEQKAGVEATEAQQGDEATEGEEAEPEYEWLLDDEGRRYRIEKLRKREGQYRRIGGSRIRTVWGPTVEIVDEDDDFFYYKVFAVERNPTPVDTGPTPEEIELILASYESTVRDVDRLAFEPIGEGLPNTGQWRNGFELADMNEDGHLDLVHGAPRKPQGPPVIFLGDGQGDFRRWRELELPPFPYDYGDVAVADFNGDGHLDLGFAMHLRGVAAMVGDGKGKFELWNEGLDFRVPGRDSGAPGFSARTLEAADWNDDGRPDLIALGEGPHLVRAGGEGLKGRQARGLAVYLNQGDGSWEPLYEEESSAYHRPVFGDELTLGDVDRDGRIDAVSASHMQGYGRILHLSRDEGQWDLETLETLRPRAYIHSSVVADFNGDGRNDLAIGYLSWELSTWRVGIDLFFAEEDGDWRRETLAAREALDRVRSLDVGDVDGDGHLDLAGVTESGWVVIYLGDGKGSFVHEDAPELKGPEGTCKGYHVRLRDVNGDGLAEVFASFAGEKAGIIELTDCPSGGSIEAWRPIVRSTASGKSHRKP